MHRDEADFRAVSEQQKDEGQVQQRRIEACRVRRELVPSHRRHPLAQAFLRREVDEDRTKEREGDPDRAQDEVFPCGFERRIGAVDADHHHGRERRELDRHPHESDVVGDQREIHREHQELVHGVIKAQIARLQSARLQLMRDVARTEYAGTEADERPTRERQC